MKIFIAILGLIILLPCTTSRAARGQTSKSSKPMAVLLVDTDDSCRLTVDDQDEGVITPDQSKKINVGLGDHIVKCVIEKAPDLMWRKVVEVKSSEQVAAMVALKALHIQYDQAVGQAQQQKDQATAAKERAAAEEKEETKHNDLLQARNNLIGTWQREEKGHLGRQTACGEYTMETSSAIILKVFGGIGSLPDVLTVQETTKHHVRKSNGKTCKVTLDRDNTETARGNIKVTLNQPIIIDTRCEDCEDSLAIERVPATRPEDIFSTGEITVINGKKISIDWRAGGRYSGKMEYDKVE